MLLSTTASCIFRYLKMLHIWSHLVQWIEMGLLVTKFVLLVVWFFHCLKNRISFNINTWKYIRCVFGREKCERELSCRSSWVPFPHTASTVLAGQHNCFTSFLSARDCAWFELLCESSMGWSLVQKKQTDGGSAQILLGQSNQKKKEGIFGKPAWVAPVLLCPERSALG